MLTGSPEAVRGASVISGRYANDLADPQSVTLRDEAGPRYVGETQSSGLFS